MTKIKNRPFSMFHLFLMSVVLSMPVPDTFPGPCSKPPSNFENYKMLVFQPNQGFLMTCNEENLSYVKIPFPKDVLSGQIPFSAYYCIKGEWVNADLFYINRMLHCVKGCPNLPSSDYLHTVTDTYKVLNDESDTTKQPAYISAVMKCQPGYYSDAKAQNQVSTQEVHCEENFYEASWNIPDGSNLETFVKCVEGCFAIGSYGQDPYGKISNFKTIGAIDGVYRYSSGEIYCDEYNGYFAVSKDLKTSLVMTCEYDHYEPANPDFYCVKGCRKPGGVYGEPAITGRKFSCSDGKRGWYRQCSTNCDVEQGYIYVNRYGDLPVGPQAEVIMCENGRFDLTKLEYICLIECSPTKLCLEGFSCTGIVYDVSNSYKRDSGRRYCVAVSPGTSSVAAFTEVSRSLIGSVMVNVFGSYDWTLHFVKSKMLSSKLLQSSKNKLFKSLLRTNKPIYGNVRTFAYVNETVMLEDGDDYDKCIPKFFNPRIYKDLKQNNFDFNKLKLRPITYSGSKIRELEVPKECPHIDLFKKYGVEMPLNFREEMKKDRQKHMKLFVDAFNVAYKHFSEEEFCRFMIYVSEKNERNVPILEPGLTPLEKKYDEIRIKFARVRIEYALKFKEKPFFKGDYMKKLGEEVARKYYPMRLKELGYEK